MFIQNRINANHLNTISNFEKNKAKIKRYGDEINEMGNEYDKFREKDPEVFNTVKNNNYYFTLFYILESTY